MGHFLKSCVVDAVELRKDDIEKEGVVLPQIAVSPLIVGGLVNK